MSTERKHLLALSFVHDLISITVCYALLRCFNDNNPLRLSSGFQYTRVFNLHATDSKITIKKDEMSRYCYLIDYLSRYYLQLPKMFINHYMDENAVAEYSQPITADTFEKAIEILNTGEIWRSSAVKFFKWT